MRNARIDVVLAGPDCRAVYEVEGCSLSCVFIEKNRMHPCINLTTILRADLKEGVNAAAQAGFKAVELWAESLERYLETHSTDDLRSLLETHHMRVVSIGDIESITFCTAEQFDELRRRCERLAEVAKRISCPTLVASASVRPRATDESRIQEEVRSVLGKLLDVVEPEGIGLALAFRGFMWCAVNSLVQAHDAVVSHPGRRAGLALDTFDLHTSGTHPEALNAVDLSQISVLRLSDCIEVPPAILSETDRVLPGEGVADLDNMLQALHRKGFRGPVSMKILSPRLWELAPHEIATIAMSVSKQYLPGMREAEGSPAQ
jgi:sugar phosphate isomerase/epimerase